MFLVASVLVPATALAGGSGTLGLSPSSPSTTTGSTFTETIQTQGTTVAVGGASASLDFDKTRLQILSVAKPAAGVGWNVSGVSFVLPNAGVIAAANGSGHLQAIAAFFTDGTSTLPMGTEEDLAVVTFFATATGTANISIPTTGSDPGGLLDGTPASYGTPVATTATGAQVTITAGTGGGSTATTNVSGTVDAGFVALTCPASITVPLVRNINNTTDFECQVGSNATWSLTVIDQNADPSTHGYMVDPGPPAKHLHDNAAVHFNKHLDASNNIVYDTDVNLAASASAQTLATGQNNLSAPLTFSQFAEPNDVAGNYGMSLRFAIATSF
jgi:hypothetical protein